MNNTIPTWEELNKRIPQEWVIYSAREGLNSNSNSFFEENPLVKSCVVTLLVKKSRTAKFQKLNNKFSSFVVTKEDYKNQVNLLFLLLEKLNDPEKCKAIRSVLPGKISGKKAWNCLQEILTDRIDD